MILFQEKRSVKMDLGSLIFVAKTQRENSQISWSEVDIELQQCTEAATCMKPTNVLWLQSGLVSLLTPRSDMTVALVTGLSLRAPRQICVSKLTQHESF